MNGKKAEGPVRISGGEEIRVGDTMLRPSVDDPAEEAKAVQDADEGVAEEGTVVRVEAQGEPVEVVPARERRRLVRMSRRATLLAAAALALAAIAIVGVVLVTGDDEKSVAAIVEDATPQTVLVRVKAEDEEGGGSGFVYDARRGLIVTNFHVVSGATEFSVGVDEQSRAAEVVAASPCDDLALLKVQDTEGLETMELTSQDSVAQGDEVVALGYPANASLEDNLTSTAGTISVVESAFRLEAPDAPALQNVVQIDVALSPGNSGGPLVSKEGKLVGVNTAIVTEIQGAPIQGQGYAIGIDRVKELVGELQDGRSRGWPGFGLQPADARTLKKEKLDLPPGIIAANPVPGTGAEALGVPQIMLTAIAGKRLAPNMTSYCSAVAGVKSGQTVDIEAVDRPGGKPKAAQLKSE